MEQLFLVPACRKDAKLNVMLTLDSKINLIETCRKCGLVLDNLLAWKTAGECLAVNIWGCEAVKEDVWEKMQPGDKVLYYGNSLNGVKSFTHYGMIDGKLHSKVLAKAIWGDESFEYIHFCEDLHRVDIKKELIFQFLGYKANHVQGFMRVNDKAVKKTLESYGTLDFLIHDMSMFMKNGKGMDVPKKIELKKRLEGYDNLINQIKRGLQGVDYRPPVAPPAMDAPQNNIQDWVNDSNPDFQGMQEVKCRLGELGEQIVYRMEYGRLCDSGRDDLAREIRIVSQKSNKYGYDILSFETDGTKRFIEVKTTSGGIKTPFKITYRELDTAERWKDTEQYIIYRIFDLKQAPLDFEYYMIKGNLKEKLYLKGRVYDAYVREYNSMH